ncbi:MAG TPA: biotin/lipoyl-binding protein [Fimbriiglobus sp.]|jgi:putative peptide zinc metalloprotease protein
MDATLLSNPAERRKQVRLKVRPDLQVTEQKYEGKIAHVVKDPVCLRYYRFNKQEYFVFQLFDGEHTMDDVRKAFEEEFKPHRLEFQDLESFARQLITAGLVQQEMPGTGKHLFRRRLKQRRSRRIAAVSNILYWKIPVFDPDRILNWMVRYLSWIFTWWFFTASVGLMLAAVLHVTLHFQTFYDKLPQYQEFFAFNSMLYLWLSLGVVKVIHEFGHGLSCKAFGGESHEMGILLMCLSPALYCNVTDAWTVANKWKRIIISFAGIYVELIIASLATFVWWYTPHLPVTNNIALCLMTLCSVSTFVFNANPLMRFDGYYMMADWLEIPNLRDRSNKFINNLFLEKCLGIEVPPEQYMATTRKWLFVVYAIASWVYRWTVTFSVIWFLSDFLGPKLKIISQMIAIASLVSMFVWPVIRVVKNIRQRGRLPDMKAKRVYVTFSVVAILAAVLFLVPLPVSRVRETGLVAVHPDAGEPVGLVSPGVLVSLEVEDGQRVRKGDVIARFDPKRLEGKVKELEAKLNAVLKEADQLRLQLIPAAPAEQKPGLERDLADAQYRAEQLREQAKNDKAQLNLAKTLVSPRDGVVTGLPRPTELGKEFEASNTETKPFCTVGDPDRLIVRAPISPVEFRLLKQNMASGGELDVSVLVKGQTAQILHGKLRQLPESDAKQVPVGLTQRAGGPLAVKQSGEQGADVTPVAQVYLIEIDIPNPDGTVRPGQLVVAKVHCHWRTAAWWVARALSTALDSGLY